MFLSTANTLPEFFLIIIGMIVIMSVVGVLLGTAKDKITDNNDKAKREKVETFSDKEIKSLDDYFRYSFGSPGESSRVLTRNYYSLFFDNKIKSEENLLALLHYRNNVYEAQGYGLNDELLKKIANRYKLNISGAIFTLVLYENSIQRNEHFIESNFQHIHQVILEEYNKVASHKYQESIKYQPITFLSIKWEFEKYGIEI